MPTTAEKIKNATERSVSHNEIVAITIDGDSDGALEAIAGLVEEGQDYDYVMLDPQTMDVWGFSGEAGDGDMDWRLTIRFASLGDD